MSKLMEGLSAEIVQEIKHSETTLTSHLEEMEISLANITNKLNKIIHKEDKNIEAAFREMETRLESQNFRSANDYLNGLNLREYLTHSNVGIVKAEDMIREALQENGQKGAVAMYYYLLQLRQKLELLVQMKYFLNDAKDSRKLLMEKYVKTYSQDFLRDLEGYCEIMKGVLPDKMKIPTVLVL